MSEKIDKKKIIEKFALTHSDTGSPEVQTALLTERINQIVHHLEKNPKDKHSRRGFLGLISKRRRLLIYLQNKDEKRYKPLIKELGLKK